MILRKFIGLEIFIYNLDYTISLNTYQRNSKIKFKIQNIKSKHKIKVNIYQISAKKKLPKIKNRERSLHKTQKLKGMDNCVKIN